jgi:hypothetical protein
MFVKNLLKNGAPEKCFTWVGSCLKCKHDTRFKRFAEDKRSRIYLVHSEVKNEKKVIRLAPARQLCMFSLHGF